MEHKFFLVILLLLLGFTLPYLIFMIRNLRDVLPYLYLNARISAKEGRLLKPETFDDMIEAGSVAEIASVLENSEYAYAIQGLVLDRAEAIEQLLTRQTASIYSEIAKMLPEKIDKVFSFLCSEWDVRNIKTILRGVRAGTSPEQILVKIIPFGEIDGELLKKMAECHTIEDLIPLLEDTPYALLMSQLASYEQQHNLLVLESLLDKILLETMWKHIEADRELLLLRPFFAARIDAANLKAIFRAKSDRLLLNDIEKYLVAGGEILDGVLKIFDEVDDIGALVAEIEGSVYYKPLMDVLPQYEKSGSLFSLEKSLDETVLSIGKQTAIKHPYGIAPVLGFLSLKEAEVKNIRAISRAKETGMLPEKIRELVVRV